MATAWVVRPRQRPAAASSALRHASSSLPMRDFRLVLIHKTGTLRAAFPAPGLPLSPAKLFPLLLKSVFRALLLPLVYLLDGLTDDRGGLFDETLVVGFARLFERGHVKPASRRDSSEEAEVFVRAGRIPGGVCLRDPLGFHGYLLELPASGDGAFPDLLQPELDSRHRVLSRVDGGVAGVNQKLPLQPVTQQDFVLLDAVGGVLLKLPDGRPLVGRGFGRVVRVAVRLHLLRSEE